MLKKLNIEVSTSINQVRYLYHGSVFSCVGLQGLCSKLQLLRLVLHRQRWNPDRLHGRIQLESMGGQDTNSKSQDVCELCWENQHQPIQFIEFIVIKAILWKLQKRIITYNQKNCTSSLSMDLLSILPPQKKKRQKGPQSGGVGILGFNMHRLEFVATSLRSFSQTKKIGDSLANQDPGFWKKLLFNRFLHLKMDGVRKFQNLWFQIYNRLFGIWYRGFLLYFFITWPRSNFLG